MVHGNYKSDILHRIRSRSVTRDNGCIEYRGDNPLKHKYGLISITVEGVRKSVPAHRAMYMALNDCFDLPREIMIRHKCDNPRCVNEEHILPGTAKDNSDDKYERGRGLNGRKYKLHTRVFRFDDETIRAIRNADGKLKWIALEFGTTTGYVSKIKNMKAKTLV